MSGSTEHAFTLLNVFAVAGDRLSGNPLCVFEPSGELTTAQMQALARQFNLSETTFVLPPTEAGAAARVRIFTPAFELPFAGHPTLGTAHVVRRKLEADGPGAPRDRVVLQMDVGLVEVTARGDDWTLRAAKTPEAHAPEATPEDLAQMLGLPVAALGGSPLWVDTGSDQLIVPLTTPDAVHAARPDARLLVQHAFSPRRGTSIAYVWAPSGPGEVVARLFVLFGGAIVEDPATGSACANLGGWMLTQKSPLPVQLRVHQGAEVSRPSLLHLHVDEAERIFVSGRVVELGRGSVVL